MTKEKEIVSNTNLKVKENDKTIIITPEQKDNENSKVPALKKPLNMNK